MTEQEVDGDDDDDVDDEEEDEGEEKEDHHHHHHHQQLQRLEIALFHQSPHVLEQCVATVGPGAARDLSSNMPNTFSVAHSSHHWASHQLQSLASA